MVNEVEVENVNADPGKEFVFTVVNEISDVNLSLMVRLVSEVPTENRSKNTESNRSG